MKTFSRILLGLSLLLTVVPSCRKTDDYAYYKKDGKIICPTPQRPKDQQSMLGYAAEPIETIRVGFIGLGMRGPGAVERFTYLDHTRIVALCDLLEDRALKQQDFLKSKGISDVDAYWGEDAWKEVCERDDIDLIYLAVPWQYHTAMAVYAMEHGKHVAVEVPAATSLKECWDLVNTSERTRKHCIMLENCIYDDFELTALNMAQHGLFGEVYHVEGAYIHNLNPYWDLYQGDWRMKYNREHHGDVYPTHGIGPVAMVLGIHRGDRMTTLVSMDTDSFHGKKLAGERYGDDTYANGDHTSTLIRTENGRTLEIQHNTYATRPYSRMFQITGTEGFANKYPSEGFSVESINGEEFVSDKERETLMKEYQHPITREVLALAKKVGGHGGMDFIMDYRLVYCLHNGLPLDMDVYDAAEWSCLVELSEVSILNGSAPVQMPDFTRGEWNKLQKVEYHLCK